MASEPGSRSTIGGVEPPPGKTAGNGRGLDVDPAARAEAALASSRERQRHHIGATALLDDPLIARSPAMVEVKALLAKIAQAATSTVLLTGESGVGKDAAARFLHRHGERAARPFVNITCSALPEALLESELFGHEKGAFTDARQRKHGLLEEAAGGTVFLDEIGEMSPTLQAKLLRFLEERAFRRVGGAVDVRPDVRVVAATNRHLREAVHEGRFRDDLYYRLAVFHVHVPPLRERIDDIELLANHFVEHFARTFNKVLEGLSPDAVVLLTRHDWPGNVRELRNVMERAALMCEGHRISAADIVLESATDDSVSCAAAPAHLFELPRGGLKLDELERELLVQALERTRGNKTQAAKLLGLTRDQIRHRIDKYRLDRLCGEFGDSPATMEVHTPSDR